MLLPLNWCHGSSCCNSSQWYQYMFTMVLVHVHNGTGTCSQWYWYMFTRILIHVHSGTGTCSQWCWYWYTGDVCLTHSCNAASFCKWKIHKSHLGVHISSEDREKYLVMENTFHHKIHSYKYDSHTTTQQWVFRY